MKFNDTDTAAVVVGLSATGLGIVRSLGKSGIPVVVLDTDFVRPSSRTKYCQKTHCPNIDDESELVGALRRIGEGKTKKSILYLSTDASVLIVSENREFLQNYYHLNLPTKRIVQIFMDKARFSHFAQDHGFEIPQTYVVNNLKELEDIANNVLYPAILKPSFRSPIWDKNNNAKAFKAFSAGKLVEFYKKSMSLTSKFLVQELIPGPDSEIYFCLVWYDSSSRCNASFVGRKIVQWPPELGGTCIAETYCDPEIVEKTRNLFDAVNYKGMGSLEFKRDSRDGRLKIVEPTVGRADLQSAIAYHAGINIPLLEYTHCLDLPYPAMHISKSVRWINEENFFWLFGHMGVSLLSTSLINALKIKTYGSLFDFQDPRPFMYFLREKLIDRFRRNS